jgi:hypothetical protein
MLLQSLDRIDGALLEKLCLDRCPESQTLEFKRDLPGSMDKDKHELCKDVAGLANSDGGDLIYGIDEKGGAAGAICPATGEPADAAIRRLGQVLDAGIEPRVQGLRLRAVDVPGGYALVVRVPGSFDGPHCVRANNNRRFVIRNGTGVVDMSFDQIRGAFGRTASLAEKASAFIAERRDRIAVGHTPVALLPGPQLALHLVPMAGQAGRRSVDVRAVHSTGFTSFVGQDWGGASSGLNLDGVYVYPGGAHSDGHYGYNQIFRTGALEGVTLIGGEVELSPGKKELAVFALEMSRFVHRWTTRFLASANDWGFAGPALLGIAVLNVQGYSLGIGAMFDPFSRAAADRPHLAPPDAWIEDVEVAKVDDLIRPLLDTLWQGFGEDRCLDFDEASGAYKPRRR